MTERQEEQEEQKDKAPSRAPRLGVIEFLQVLSLLVLPSIYFLSGVGYKVFAGCLAAALALLPFWLVRPPKRAPLPHVDWQRGFKITHDRRRTLAAIGVPYDILSAIDESMIDIFYPKAKELREALYEKLGEERVQPWIYDILLHSKYYGDHPEATFKKEQGTVQDAGGVESHPLVRPASAAQLNRPQTDIRNHEVA